MKTVNGSIAQEMFMMKKGRTERGRESEEEGVLYTFYQSRKNRDITNEKDNMLKPELLSLFPSVDTM